jgi:hypothetical protein
MTEGAAWQGGMVSDLNADAQIGVGRGIEIVFINWRGYAPIEKAIIVPQSIDVI